VCACVRACVRAPRVDCFDTCECQLTRTPTPSYITVTFFPYSKPQPCQSVARHLIHEAELSRQLEHFRFTWVVRDTNLLDALPTVATDGRSYLADHETGEESEASPSKSSRFYPEVYVTRAQDEDLVGRNNVTKGRPDIQRIIQETIAVAKSKGASRIAVVTCGPERMVDEVKAECRKSTNICGPIALDVHDEIFNF